MSILEVLKYPDARLRRKAQNINQVTEEMRVLAENMLETMYLLRGIGLAATQVGELISLLVVDTQFYQRNDGHFESELKSQAEYAHKDKDENKDKEEQEMTDLEKQIIQPIVIFNPTIIKQKGKQTFDEGCLSLPSYYEIVERANEIEIKGIDANNKDIIIKTDGLLSVCLQHEMDHLNGKLFIDRVSFIKSNRIKNKIKKFGYPNPNSKISDSENKKK